MHGLILVQLQKFAHQAIGPDIWREALAKEGLNQQSFSSGSVYEDSKAIEQIVLASSILGIPVDQVVESFGVFISKELIRLYQRVIKPEWKTLDIIENTETFIHSAVRAGNPGAVPPVLDAIRISDNHLQLLYSSDRKLCKLAIGIIKGMSSHFQEVIEIHHDSCMHKGDPYCSFRLIQHDLARDTDKIELDVTQVVLSSESKRIVKSPIESTSTANSFAIKEKPKKTDWSKLLEPAIVPSDIASIGAYRLVSIQGEGGMGCVFKSIDNRTQQVYAIKVLHPKVAEDDTACQRLRREWRALQSIDHPRIVEVHDVGEFNDLPYLVMEFLSGSNLQTYRSRFNTLPIHEILRIAIETTEGLLEVHRSGMIHRDLKPENLWIESPSLSVKIIDFGLAHLAQEEIRLTRTGTFIGTPSFMAPEQASGLKADFRTDFFSLGCILYDLITGKRPFDRKSIISTFSALANHNPPDPIELVPDTPKELSELIMFMLEKKPEDRPSSCQEILDSLIRIRTNLL
jgi:tRNA A-37 threonylcarbamoyl transferase component Bud32/predicted hydrocarbon binding protein